MSGGFKQIGFQTGTGGGYGHNTSIAQSDSKMLAIQSEGHHHPNDQSPLRGHAGGGAGFFMTETE